MTKLLVIAILVSVGTASAETSPPAPDQAPNPAMVRNIGIAEQGDAIVVRTRKPEPVPATKSEQK
ncbi:hypothetical protein LJR220_001693 [Bradyrhizobium sp. LjRoot220]|uniref:hypothetical protein n=1 Tax=Bradyrhizobium sp. LjRoot220 TaxID=3342284 RepID=UPI003ECF7DAD